MQTPSAADPSFKAFLDKLQEQNNRGLATQLVQLKAERENAGKDNDKREEQLDEVIDSLKEVRLAVTGVSLDVDITPLVDIGENQTRLLEELSKESSLLRKLSEGSVEYDKEASQYRNTSGKEVESVVTGKTSKRGGFLDFETARDTLSGQGKRVREDNKLAIKPIEYVPGKLTGKVTGVEKTKEDKDKIDNSVPDTRGFFATLIDELNAAPGRVRDYLIDHEEKSQANKDKESSITNNVVEKNKDNTVTNNVEKVTDTKDNTVTNNVERVIREDKQELSSVERVIQDNSSQDKSTVEKAIKEREIKVSSDREKTTSIVNPESDNIRDSQEIIADNSKSDLELSKQMLDTTKAQLTVLKEIRDALTPKTPGELSSGNGPPSPGSKVAETEEGGGLGVGDALAGLGGLAKKAGGAIVKGAKAVGRGALSLGGGIAKFAASGAGKALGATAAVGLGAYTAYKGYTAAEDSKQAKLEGVQTQLDAGQITTEEAAAQRKEIGNTATVEKSGAVGEGTGMAGGAIAGGLAGAKLGAAIGSIIPGAGTVIGAGIGTIAGGALGAFAGSKAGKAVGEYGGKAINAAGDFFGGIGDKVKGVYSGGVGLNDQAKGVAQADQAVATNTVSSTSEVSGKGLTTTKSDLKQGITAEKTVLGSTFLGGLFTAKGKTSGNFLGSSSEETKLQGKVEGRQIDSTDNKTGETFGRRISGGLLGTDTYKVTNKAGEEQEVSKMEYNKLQGLAKEGKVDEVHASLDKMAAAKAAALEPSGVDAMGNATGQTTSSVQGVSVEQAAAARTNYASVDPRRVDTSTAAGATVAQTSTENADMTREASKGGANNTVVSNNVSNNETTKFMPSKPSPRPEFTGSALDRYLNKTAVY